VGKAAKKAKEAHLECLPVVAGKKTTKGEKLLEKLWGNCAWIWFCCGFLLC